MARKSEIRYIRYYTDGSAARQMEPKPRTKRQKVPKPRTRQRQELVIRVDPLAVCAIVVAAVLLVLLVVGAVQLNSAKQQRKAMAAYVAGLEMENASLQRTYEEGYDLEQVEKMALDLGLVPASQVQTVEISVDAPEPAPEPTFWQRILDFFGDLFA